MVSPSGDDITQLLRAWGDGNQAALDRLMPLVYAQLRQAAHRYMARERHGHTLQSTALVNEVYVRLAKAREMRWQDRVHFFAISAQMMRRILTDHARARQYAKRGGGAQVVSLDEAPEVSPKPRADLVALDDALNHLAAVDERKSRVVELRYFGGLSVEETGEVLKVSPETVMRDWKLAKAWLLRELSGEQGDES
ncbi:MAG: sigma-70 family RNA polymerase sigma factor [Terriglobia bacterium]|jgi:RNA polymerase sigma factor (TIGR02999 family)